jgi:hypothetical protein
MLAFISSFFHGSLVGFATARMLELRSLRSATNWQFCVASVPDALCSLARSPTLDLALPGLFAVPEHNGFVQADRRDPSTLKACRKRLIANNEIRAHSLNRPARSRFGISAEELFIERADLHFGESCPETEVLTGSEPDIRRLRTSDVKPDLDR